MYTALLILMIIPFCALLLFAYFRNRRVKKIDERRKRLWKKQEMLMQVLEKEQDGAE